MTNTPRIMIIVWSWKYGGMEEPYDSWEVAGRPGDRLIRIDERYSATAVNQVKQLIDAQEEAASVFLFLHRRHGYTNETLSHILEAINSARRTKNTVRGFLFGEGNDYIYIATQNRGLLGTKGTFSAMLQSPYHASSQLVSAVADANRRLLKVEHFNAVWRYYAHNFKAKLVELREDLFGAIWPISLEESVDSSTYYIFLQQTDNQLLFLRLLSFIGKIRKGSDLEQTLKNYEQQLKRSFFFDDCRENLKTVYGEQKGRLYESLVSEIRKQLFVHHQQVDLLQLRARFDDLLCEMPEAAYN